VPKGGPSDETGIPWQPIGVEPILAKILQESEMTHLEAARSRVTEVEII